MHPRTLYSLLVGECLGMVDSIRFSCMLLQCYSSVYLFFAILRRRRVRVRRINALAFGRSRCVCRVAQQCCACIETIFSNFGSVAFKAKQACPGMPGLKLGHHGAHVLQGFAYRAGVLFHHSQCLIQIQCKSFWTPASEDRESQVCPGIPGIAVHHGAEIRAPCRRSLAGARILTMHGGRLKFSHNPTTSFARCVDRGSFLSQVSTWTATALRGV